MKNNNNIEKDRFSEIIKSKLENYSLSLENVSWDDLEKHLPAKELSKKQVFWPWISSISVAASIAVVWFLYPLINNKNNINNEQQHTQLSGNEEGFSESLFSDANISLDCVPSKKIGSAHSGQKLKESDTQSLSLQFDLIQPNLNLATKSKVINPKKMRLMATATSYDRLFPSPIYDATVSKKQSSLGLHFSSGGLFADKQPPTYGSLRSVSETKYNRKIYRPPFSLGLSVRKELNRTFSVESGLIYTYLSTTFDNPIPSEETPSDQKAFSDLHYLGIPLNLITNIYGNQHTRWNVYFLVGGTAEKGILSQAVQRSSTETTRVNEKAEGFQTSLHSSFGLNYKIADSYSVYLEPGLRYYLKNNQPINIRTEFPLVLNVNIGLRYNW